MENLQDLLTTTEAAQILGCDRRTVIRWVDSGKLPAVRTPGNHRHVRRADVEALLEPKP